METLDKRARLQAIIRYYSNGNKADFARKLGISPQGLSTWEKRNTYNADLIYSKCGDISGEWLLTGEGEMLRKSGKVRKKEEVERPYGSGEGVDDSDMKQLFETILEQSKTISAMRRAIEEYRTVIIRQRDEIDSIKKSNVVLPDRRS
jgi:transcriptional regulator with XRE-family HTH domain